MNIEIALFVLSRTGLELLTHDKHVLVEGRLVSGCDVWIKDNSSERDIVLSILKVVLVLLLASVNV